MQKLSQCIKKGMKLRDVEQIVILDTLTDNNFNRTHTARALGIGIRTLQRKLKRYGVEGNETVMWSYPKETSNA